MAGRGRERSWGPNVLCANGQEENTGSSVRVVTEASTRVLATKLQSEGGRMSRGFVRERGLECREESEWGGRRSCELERSRCEEAETATTRRTLATGSNAAGWTRRMQRPQVQPAECATSERANRGENGESAGGTGVKHTRLQARGRCDTKGHLAKDRRGL